MAEIVDIEAFKAKKLDRLVQEWTALMDRIAILQKEGKMKFADEMIRKAKALREQIDKLRGPQKKPEAPACPPVNWAPLKPSGFHFTPFLGLSQADMGHRQENKITPEPENN